LRPNIWPGLALAGGVVAAAVIALILLGGVGPTDGTVPSAANAADTRLFPGENRVAGEPGSGGSRSAQRRGRPAPGGSAATFEYLVDENRGVVLGGP
jgi:hypothetical protein